MFLDQCKRKGIKIEDLDKGWVPQHKIGEESDDEVVEDEDDEEDDEEMNEDELFSSRPSAPRREKKPEKTEASDDNEVVTFKMGGEKKKEEAPATPVTAEKPEMSLADLEAMFGPSSTPIEETKPAAPVSPSVSSMYGDPAPSAPSGGLSSPYGTPNRDRIGNALSQADVGGSGPSITYDKTSTDPGAAASTVGQNGKPKIKLNIRPKNPM